MGYRGRYEDSYLDDEEDDADGKTEVERIVALLEKAARTETEETQLGKLTERLFGAVRMGGAARKNAVEGIGTVADAYAALGMAEPAIALWARLSDIAEDVGDRELYYKAVDEMGALG